VFGATVVAVLLVVAGVLFATSQEAHDWRVRRTQRRGTGAHVPDSRADGHGGYLMLEVYQASGMVSAQLGCIPDEALARLTARALEVGCTLDEMARAVLDRSVRFER
jgi:hypothetical protein